MLCSNCNNLVKKVPDGTVLKYICSTCGSTFKTNERDTLIYESGKETHYRVMKDGRDIYHYPANQKIFKKCEKCSSPIVAFEVDKKNLTRIYGCQCGHSWEMV
jgi:DNA-directed RNA polymerase subunit M/transcription elongation factor TFIIS